MLTVKTKGRNTCAEECYYDKNCLSFEILKRRGLCYLSKESAASSNNLKFNKDRDYYHLLKGNYCLVFCY